MKTLNEMKADERPSVSKYKLYDNKGHIQTFMLTLSERFKKIIIQSYCKTCKKAMGFKT